MRFTIFQDSRLGDRKNNEDRVGYSYSRDVLLMAVADGMGGHHGGEVAAEIAVNELVRRFQQEARNKLKKPFEFLVSAIQSGHRAIVSHAVEHNLLECPRTTMVACIVQNGCAYWAHAGDSRLYVLRHGEVAAQTQDHSRVQMMIDSGEITKEAAARHPERNKIFSCLGGVVPPQIATSKEFPLQKGDTIMLCTDGFWGQMPGGAVGNVLRTKTVVDAMPSLLQEAQRRARGESDNLSVVAMTWEAQDDPNVADTQELDTGFTNSSNMTTETLDGNQKDTDDVTDEDIERAINEIQDAIRRVPR